MEREIKFRAYNDKTNEMVYSNSLKDGKISRDIEGYENYFIQVEHAEVMQYTGLKDKNGKGKEVYRGDLLKSLGTDIMEVIWSTSTCSFMLKQINLPKDEVNLIPCSESNLRYREVIGNIYENPELLKQ